MQNRFFQYIWHVKQKCLSYSVQLLQTVSISCCAAEAAGAGRWPGDVSSAAAFLQLLERPAGSKHTTRRRNYIAQELKIEHKKIIFLHHRNESAKVTTSQRCFLCAASEEVKLRTWSETHLSLLVQISGELGLDDVSDLTSCEWGHASVFWSLHKQRGCEMKHMSYLHLQ